ncbi:unnamed protein product, partial [Mesorhabditis belari]|uniref:Large ribosomal subunit protein bL17m n=1 Tax=Mesorhabditis belari TaxID=2138241 RepID=A0AAF3FBW4_9BILA
MSVRWASTLPRIKATIGHIPQRLKDGSIPTTSRARLEILRQIVTRLVREERIELKWNRAVEARPYMERLIQMSLLHPDDEYTQKMLDWWLLDHDLKDKMAKVITPRFVNAEGPYTSIYRIPDQLLTSRLRGGKPVAHRYQIAVLEIDGNPFPSVFGPMSEHSKVDSYSMDPFIPGTGRSASTSAEDAQKAYLAELRAKITVGWFAGPFDANPKFDKAIATYSQRFGFGSYNFVCYPIGGAKRGFWKYDSATEMPPIDLPDLQLQNSLWETYVNGQISTWIDCDSHDEQLALLSESEISKELNYACYLGLRNVTVHLKHASSPRLAAILRKWLWTKNAHLTIWVFVPTTLEVLERNHDDPDEIWTIWANFRRLCNDFFCKKLLVGLHLQSNIDDEFVDEKLSSRWRGEPLLPFCIDYDIFMNATDNPVPMLSRAHADLLSKLWMKEISRVVIRGPLDKEVPQETLINMATSIRKVVDNCSFMAEGFTDTGFLSCGTIDYMDVLQMPLQPLSDNLDSGVYNTFEQDPVKYKKYQEAVNKAVDDLGESPGCENIVLYVLGAGRGPLVTASIEAIREYNKTKRTKHNQLESKIVVVEKNPNAVVTLRYCNEKAWKNKCTIVESDMRTLEEKVNKLNLPKPDIIVSELLGSFGDNELSPECLDGVTSVLKPTTISIPQSYTNYIAPIHSTFMHQSVINGATPYWCSGMGFHGRSLPEEQDDGSWKIIDRKGPEITNMDQVYVVFLRSYFLLAKPVPVFKFDHPNFKSSSNERNGRVKFTMEINSDIMGFAGYFHMTLYKDVVLSIEPSTHSPGLISWFPALIPLRKMHRLKSGDQVTFCIDRKIDDTGVWYEWFIEYEENGLLKQSPLQNENGESYYMRL